MNASGRRFAAVLSGRWALIGLFVLASIAALRIGKTLVLPVMMAGILALVLAPVVAWLSRRRIPAPLGAAIVMLSLVASLVAIVYALSGPAAAWLDRVPESLATAEAKIQSLTRPIEKLQATAEAVEEVASGNKRSDTARTDAAPGGLFGKVSGTTVAFLGAFATVIFLSYFLLATAPRFRSKLAEILPAYQREEVAGTVAEIQEQMSRYLLLATTINVGVGLVTYGVLALQGMPNPGLWGAMAGVLNFIPYLGAVVTVGVIALAGLVTFDQTSQALMAAGSFFVINLIEANVVTPMLMGMRLPLNPVAIFGGLMFWGWLWGVTGAVLAVPLMVMVKVVADRVDALKPIGVMLGP